MTTNERKQIRRTKIVATLGPSTDKPGVLERMIRAGMDLARINFSHGTAEEQRKRVEHCRQLADQNNREVGILMDLQGPKIRISKFKTGSIQLTEGHRFTLDANLGTHDGDETQVGIDYKSLPSDVVTGDILPLNDGRIVLEVSAIEGDRIHTIVNVGGKLSDNKGINRQGGGLSAKALTSKDKEDILTAVSLEADYIAVSFPRSAKDIEETKDLIKRAGGHAAVMAKIERKEAVDTIDEIIDAADAIMVARGDLGVEIGDAVLPGVQKEIIHKVRAKNKAVITATQMMESMIRDPIPTRAEVFDVGNAVLDGADAVMLSEETAMGVHPAKVVEAMARICLGAEKERRAQTSKHRIESRFHFIDEAIAMASMYVANHLDIKAIIALTESGSTPLWMSRIRSGIPIYGFSRHVRSRRRMTLYRGVYPIHFDATVIDHHEMAKRAMEALCLKGILSVSDRVIITMGDLVGIHGKTNTLSILEVGSEHVETI